jgi:hypothetical protein
MLLVDDDLGCVGFVTLLSVDLAVDSLGELKLSNDLCLALRRVAGIDASAVPSNKGVDSDRSTNSCGVGKRCDPGIHIFFIRSSSF